MQLKNVSDFLEKDDIVIKEITIPDSIPVWGGDKMYIAQLTRGQQDKYSHRVSGNMQLIQRGKNEQIISGMSADGNDAWLCVHGIVNEEGKRIFKEAHIDALNAKSGEAIGWIAKQIVEFSGMADDDSKSVEMELSFYREKFPEAAEEYKKKRLSPLEDEVKN